MVGLSSNVNGCGDDLVESNNITGTPIYKDATFISCMDSYSPYDTPIPSIHRLNVTIHRANRGKKPGASSREVGQWGCDYEFWV